MATEDEILAELKSLNRNYSGNRGNSSPTIGSGSSGGSLQGAGDAGAAISSLGNPVSALKKSVESSVSSWQQASNIGIGFNNDAIGLRTSVATTRLGIDEYGQVIKNAQLGITALGGTVSNGARAFNQLSYEFSNTEGADQLRKMGYTTKEYNDVLALSVTGRKNIDMNDKVSRDAAIASATELATEMDKVAQLTGVSRKEQQEALLEKQKNARVQVTIDAMTRAGGAEAAASYQSMSTQLKGIGLDKLGDELYTGQALTKKAQEQLNALGPAGTELRNSITAVREAKTKEERDAADARLKNAQGMVAAYQETETYRELVRRGEGPVADAAREAYISGKNFRDGAVKTGEATKTSIETAAKINGQMVKNAQAGKDVAGKDVEGAKITGLYVQSAARVADTNVILAKSLDALNQRLGGSAATAKGLEITQNIKPSNGLGVVPAGTPTASAERGGILPEAVTKAPSLISNANSISDVTKGITDIGKGSAKELGMDFNGMMGGMKDFFKSPGRADGSMGAVGKLIEDFGAGTPMMLHGREGIITEKQMNSLLGSMKGISTTISSATPAPVSMPESASSAPVSTGKATLDDVVERLEYLNKTMGQLASHSESIADASVKTARATKRLDPNVSLR